MPRVGKLVAGGVLALAAMSSVSASGVDFDYYELATFWPAQICAQRNSHCSKPYPFWEKHFTIHGLWPQNTDGSYPKNCQADAWDLQTVEQVVDFETLKSHWPNPNDDGTSGVKDYDDFWQHEWNVHGRCSGLGLQGYFETAVDLIEAHGTPAYVGQKVGQTVPYDKLKQAFGGDRFVALQCDDRDKLSGAITCWTKEKSGVGAQMPCPANVQSKETCHGAEIYITSF